jgi:hypothetical protein
MFRSGLFRSLMKIAMAVATVNGSSVLIIDGPHHGG